MYPSSDLTVKQLYKTCVNCRSKVKTPCTQLKRTDTDFVDGNLTVEKNMCKPSLPIGATYVATLLGLNKYKTDLHELVMKYWKRGEPMSFQDTQNTIPQEGVEFASVISPDEES